MLEPVTLGQTRFVTPGIVPDARGIVLGRGAVVQFASIEGVVSWLRLYADEASLDELLGTLRILRVETSLRGKEFLIRISVASSYVLDRAARCARLAGGLTFTGTELHFVRYRDDQAPYGYDVTEVNSVEAGVSYVLHDEFGTRSYRVISEMDFQKLLFRLSLKRHTTRAIAYESIAGRSLLLVVERGLDQGIIRYLWRNNIEATVGWVTPSNASSFDERNLVNGFLIFRVEALPKRLLELFMVVPGISVFLQETDNVAVEFGFSHPIQLASCASAFGEDKFYLFWGKAARVDEVAGPLELSRIENFTEVIIQKMPVTDASAIEPVTLEASEHVDLVGVQMRLAPAQDTPKHVVATLIPLAQAEWLKRLVYFLPPTMLKSNRLVVTDRGILVVGEQDMDVVPLGEQMVEQSPGLIVPMGLELVPRVDSEVLAAALGHGTGIYSVFPRESAPFQVSNAALVPLERKVLAQIEVHEVKAVNMSAVDSKAVRIVNDDFGRFALWGFDAPGGSSSDR